MADNNKIPQIRFPNFEVKWNDESMGKVYSFKVTNSFSRDNLSHSEGDVKNIHYGDIHKKLPTLLDITKEDIPFIKPDVSIDRISEENYCMDGDMIFADASEDINDVGKAIEIINTNNEKLLSGLHTILARPDLQKLTIGFGGYLFTSEFVRTQIQKESQGTKVLSISATRLSKVRLKFPSDEKEQTKIASFFSAIDGKIKALKNKKEQLEEYKKGVAQKLFSQEIRFKDDNGKSFPDWEELELSDFLIPTLREVPTPEENYLAIGIRSHCKGTFQKPDSDPSKISMDKLFTVKENDLIVNITFAWEGAIALVKKEDEGGHVSHRFPTYTFNRDLVIHEFFQFVFVQKEFRNILDLISPGGAGRNRVLSKKEFLKIKWLLPKVDEQTKIADFLSSIDQKIELVDNKLNETEQWKKGLLQKMFC